jgi:hypothetical protein
LAQPSVDARASPVSAPRKSNAADRIWIDSAFRSACAMTGVL